jgi:hypothetical protein
VSARAKPEIKESTNTDVIEMDRQILANFILGTSRPLLFCSLDAWMTTA